MNRPNLHMSRATARRGIAVILTAAAATAGAVVGGASPASAATGCHEVISLPNPDTGTIDNKTSISFSYETSYTAGSGRDETRIAVGNAIFFINNHTDTYAFEIRNVIYKEFVSGTTHATASLPAGGGVVYHGTELGMKINADGSVAAPWSSTSPVFGGFRSWIEKTSDQQPDLDVYIFSVSTRSYKVVSLWYAGQTPSIPCGSWYRAS